MAARTGRPYKLQVLSTNGERKLQGSANNPTDKDVERKPTECLEEKNRVYKAWSTPKYVRL